MLMSNNALLQVSLYVQHWRLGASALHAMAQQMAQQRWGLQPYNGYKIVMPQPLTKERQTLMRFAIEKGCSPLGVYTTTNAVFWTFTTREDADKFLASIDGSRDPRISNFQISAC